MNTQQNCENFMNKKNKLAPFIQLLSELWIEKKNKNPNFSQRAYARYLDIPVSTLSVLQSKKTISESPLISKLGKKLGLSNDEIKYFSLLAKSEKTKDPKKKRELIKQALGLNTRFNTLSDEQFNYVASWYHFALMELIKTKDATFNPEWISQKLGIKIEEAEKALQALIDLKIIKIQNNKLKVLKDYISLPTGASLPVAFNYHQEMIQKSLEATKTQTKEERNFSSVTLRVRRSDLPKVNELLRTLRREFCHELEEGEGHDSVYALNMQFIRLDKD